MIIYWLNLLLIPFWPLLFKIIGIKNNRLKALILFIQLYIILALRAPFVGADIEGYLKVFERTKQFPFFEFEINRFEPGYLLLNKILMFLDSHQVFIAVLAFIPLSLVFFLIYKESQLIWLSVFLFISLGFYTDLFSALRQSIAMGLIAYSYQFIKKDKGVIFVGLVIVASLFHISVLSFLPVYFIRKWDINYKTIGFYSFIAIIVLLFSSPIINFSTKLFGTIDYEFESSGGLGYLLLLLFLISVGLYFKKVFLFKYPEDSVLYHILCMAVIYQLLALEFSLMTRVTQYFSMFLIVFIPNIVTSIRDKKLIIFGVYLICFLTMFMYYSELIKDLSSIVPYSFFFNN